MTEASLALRGSMTSEELTKRVGSTAACLGKELARRLPSVENAALAWIDSLSQGRIRVELDTAGLERSVAKAGEVGRQATVGIIVVGQLVGTAIVMSTLLQPALGSFQFLGLLAMAAFATSLTVSFMVLRRVLRGPTS